MKAVESKAEYLKLAAVTGRLLRRNFKYRGDSREAIFDYEDG